MRNFAFLVSRGAFLVVLMSNIAYTKSVVVSEDIKPTLVLEMVSMMSKITKHKLNGPNYLEWSKTILIYIKSIRMDAHLNKDSPIDALPHISVYAVVI